MFELDKIDTTFNYRIYQSPYLAENQATFIESAKLAFSRFEFVFPKADSTWFYRYYNFFQLTAGSSDYHKLYVGLTKIVRDYVGTEEPLWLQCWMNFHTVANVLKRHNHSFTVCNGYISIDPKESQTVFDGYTIDNKVGQLYIGPDGIFHYVKVLEQYAGNRITIAFDVLDNLSYQQAIKKSGEIDFNTGYLPI